MNYSLHKYITSIKEFSDTEWLWFCILKSNTLFDFEFDFDAITNCDTRKIIIEEVCHYFHSIIHDVWCDDTNDREIQEYIISVLDTLIKAKEGSDTPEQFETLLRLLK